MKVGEKNNTVSIRHEQPLRRELVSKVENLIIIKRDLGWFLIRNLKPKTCATQVYTAITL